MNIKLSNIIIILLTIITIPYSQVTLEWARRYNGPLNDYDAANAIVVDDSCYVYVTGGSKGNGTDFDYLTIKYRPNGDSVWIRRYNDSINGFNSARDILVDITGNVYVTGAPATIKYSPSGSVLWIRQNDAECFSMKQDLLGNIYVTGSGLSDYVTKKFDSNGNLKWNKTYNGPANDYDKAEDLVIDPFGNIIVTGRSWGIGTQLDYATVKYDSSGNQLWVRRYNGPALNVPTDVATALAVDDSANVYVTGWSEGTDEDWDCVTIKYKPNGDTAWIQRFIGSTATGDDITLDRDNNIYVTGYFQGNYILIKYNSNGGIVWQRTTPSPGGFFIPISHVITDTLSNVYLSATKRISSQILNNLIIKYDSSGNIIWSVEYNGGAPEEANYSNAIFLDKNINVYAAGARATGTFLYDYQTLKYSQITGISKISNVIPGDYTLFQNYPNPFNPITKIKFDLPTNAKSEKSNVKIIICDVLGREVSILVNENLRAGKYEVEWEASDFPSGVYFYRLRTENYVETMKMVLIR